MTRSRDKDYANARFDLVRAWRRMDLGRVVAIAAVVAIYTGGVVLLLRPAGPVRPYHIRVRTHRVAGALRVRLIDVHAVPSPALKAHPPHPPKPAARASQPRVTRQRNAAATAVKPRRHARQVPVLTLPSDWVAQQRRKKGATVGRALVARAHAVARVPGTASPVYGMPVFAMADPRYEGLAGIVRVIQSMLGAVNPHCVDVDAWHRMSPEALGRRHISLQDVARTAKEYHCVPPERGSAAARTGRH